MHLTTTGPYAGDGRLPASRVHQTDQCHVRDKRAYAGAAVDRYGRQRPSAYGVTLVDASGLRQLLLLVVVVVER